MIYKGKWKLLLEPGWYNQTSKKHGIVSELYDLKADPSERNEVSRSNPEIVELLSGIAAERKASQGIVDYENIIKINPRDPY